MRWRFWTSYGAILATLTLALLTSGCAGLRHQSTEVNGQDLHQQLDAAIDEYLEQVLDQCIEIHGLAQAGKTGVDCSYTGDLRAMHLSLPSRNHFQLYQADVTQLSANWCAASQSKTGKQGYFVIHLREEQKAYRHTCYYHDQAESP